ncbi:hypothetical protein Murmansk-147 [Murmansk poxvirus]|uniref:Uncharacterized protein n=1 Tax=Murmansk poxvirus TaxID=2025359 RepID=A0A223FMZ8_9POXV|nr:hypothetical protein CKM52_gp147 [Murmansk poxvirus]AST09342.1 hypothetical protein Murmansk-147 [Murmansk poxvirus]
MSKSNDTIKYLCKSVLYIYVLQAKCLVLNKLVKYYYNEVVDDDEL